MDRSKISLFSDATVVEPDRPSVDGGAQDAATPVIYQTARNRADLIGAFQLLQQRYAEAGLAIAGGPGMRILPYHLWSETQVMIACQQNRVIGSISLTRDGHPEGVPMESTYGDTIRDLRAQGYRLGEVCSLSVDSPQQVSSGELFAQLTRLMMFHARYVNLDYLVAVVHPRHAKFYQRAMGFKAIGGLTRYQQVGGQPGIAILGHAKNRLSYRQRWQQHYFDGHFSDEELKPRPLCDTDRAFFRPFVSAPDQGQHERRAA
ncbi:N-acyl amino acid synthase FeeM domain-containing protein [Roseimaritima ulvae]|uniref:N-acyl amino acid synthase FeeM catalytic core domain-containing protein n=1 Tax=Roseimaritima ulvae TaxID=980254 RepID=A0A5B9QZC0_9BACT|nr:hypothetical protein [Roseimaritima ulvae]QEG42526.1 hypothetical protein UC8_45660 [Roseimaritima ulvae]